MILIEWALYLIIFLINGMKFLDLFWIVINLSLILCVMIIRLIYKVRLINLV